MALRMRSDRVERAFCGNFNAPSVMRVPMMMLPSVRLCTPFPAFSIGQRQGRSELLLMSSIFLHLSQQGWGFWLYSDINGMLRSYCLHIILVMVYLPAGSEVNAFSLVSQNLSLLIYRIPSI